MKIKLSLLLLVVMAATPYSVLGFSSLRTLVAKAAGFKRNTIDGNKEIKAVRAVKQYNVDIENMTVEELADIEKDINKEYEDAYEKPRNDLSAKYEEIGLQQDGVITELKRKCKAELGCNIYDTPRGSWYRKESDRIIKNFDEKRRPFVEALKQLNPVREYLLKQCDRVNARRAHFRYILHTREQLINRIVNYSIKPYEFTISDELIPYLGDIDEDGTTDPNGTVYQQAARSRYWSKEWMEKIKQALAGGGNRVLYSSEEAKLEMLEIDPQKNNNLSVCSNWINTRAELIKSMVETINHPGFFVINTKVMPYLGDVDEYGNVDPKGTVYEQAKNAKYWVKVWMDKIADYVRKAGGSVLYAPKEEFFDQSAEIALEDNQENLSVTQAQEVVNDDAVQEVVV